MTAARSTEPPPIASEARSGAEEPTGDSAFAGEPTLGEGSRDAGGAASATSIGVADDDGSASEAPTAGIDAVAAAEGDGAAEAGAVVGLGFGFAVGLGVATGAGLVEPTATGWIDTQRPSQAIRIRA